MAADSNTMPRMTTGEIVGTPTLDPAGRVVDAEAVLDEQLRVTIRTVDGPVQTAWNRVETDPQRDDVLQAVRELCNDPDADSTPSTMARWPSLQGRLAGVYNIPGEECKAAVRRAIAARDLSCVRWDDAVEIGEDAEGTRCVFPLEESHVRKVIAEFATDHERRGDVIEHCQALLEEVEG